MAGWSFIRRAGVAGWCFAVLAACGDSGSTGGAGSEGGGGGLGASPGGGGEGQGAGSLGGGPSEGGMGGGLALVENPDKVGGDHEPALASEPFPPIIPDTIIGEPGCAIGDYSMGVGWVDTFGACAICQCTTWGARCAKRATCPNDICVFADGTLLNPGESALVDGCFVCTCDASGGSCVRYSGGTCPDDGCLVSRAGVEIAFDQQVFVSECHACTCDPVDNVVCEDLCHPECVTVDREGEVVLQGLDQEHVAIEGQTCHCICDYGSVVCDDRCPPRR